MSKFKYYAFNEDGNIVKNYIVEDDIEVAKEKLHNKHYQIIKITPIFHIQGLSLVKPLKEDILAGFCGNVAVILDSGVTIIRGLDILAEQTHNKAYKSILVGLLNKIKKGQKMSTAMGSLVVFPQLLVDMIAAGELTGNLTDILFSMEKFYAREVAIKSRIKSASIYPIILLAAAVMMILFFNLFVFTELKGLFQNMDDLPKMTSLLIGGLEYLNNHPLRLTIILIIGILMIKAIFRIETISFNKDKFMLYAPVFGRVKKDLVMARVSSSMAIFIRASIPLVRVLTILEALVANKYIGKYIATARLEITEGSNIADAFSRCDVFDSMMIQMIRIGEETGKLEEMLFRLADIYEKKSEAGISRIVALIEPAFTLVVGVLVGAVIIAMAMPIFNMSSMFK